MSPIRIPPAHDLPIIISDDLPQTVQLYKKYLLQGPASFSYDPARSLARLALDHSQNLSFLINQCELTRPPVGRKPNAEVIRALWRLGSSKIWKIYDAPKWHYDFRADLTVSVRTDQLIVENGKTNLLWLQMRTGKAIPDQAQLGLLARIFMLQAKRAGFKDLGFLIANMRTVIGNERAIELLSLDNLEVVSEADAKLKLQIFADAYDQVIHERFDPKAEREARRKGMPKEGPQPRLI